MGRNFAKYVNKDRKEDGDGEETCNKQRLPYVLSKEQLIMILETCTDIRMAMVVFLGCFQGLRIREILRLTWSDIDLEYGEVRILDGKNPTRYKSGYGKDRIVPLNDMFIPVLKKWKKMTEGVSKYVIPVRNSPASIRTNRADKEVLRNFQVMFMDNLDRAGLKIVDHLQTDGRARYKYHLHTLRHVCGTNLYRLGLDIFKIKDFLGHADIESTYIYCELGRDDLRKASHLAYAYPKSHAPIPEPQSIEITMNRDILELQNQILDKKLKLMQLNSEVEVPYANMPQ